MYSRDLFIGLMFTLISVVGFVFSWWAGTRWKGKSVWRKLSNALVSGVGFWICFICGVVALNHLGFLGSETNWNRGMLSSLLCLTFPMVVLTTIGIFVWSLQREVLQEFLSGRLDKIVQKSRRRK